MLVLLSAKTLTKPLRPAGAVPLLICTVLLLQVLGLPDDKTSIHSHLLSLWCSHASGDVVRIPAGTSTSGAGELISC